MQIIIHAIIALLCPLVICHEEPAHDKNHFEASFLKCKNICVGDFQISYRFDLPICKCQVEKNIGAAEMEKMQKDAKSLNIKLKITKSLPEGGKRNKNHIVRRHILENVGNVEPLGHTATTSFDVKSVSALQAKSNSKNHVLTTTAAMPIAKPQNTQFLLEKAQERIKQLKEQRYKQYLASKRFSPVSMSSAVTVTIPTTQTVTTDKHAKSQRILEKNIVQQFETDINFFKDSQQAKSILKRGHPSQDMTFLRPIDFVPSGVRQFVPHIPAVMGRPPLASSQNDVPAIDAQALPQNSGHQGVIPPPPTSGFQVVLRSPLLFSHTS